MKLKYFNNKKLPKLAWCAISKRNSKEIKVHHGNGVETHENFFVEGAWDGVFCSAGFCDSTFFMGSGAIVLKSGGGALFATPTHTFERLYSISDDGMIYISNSLPFILYISGLELDPKYMNYEVDFNSILKGIKKYTRTLPLNKDKNIQLHYYCNLLLNKGRLTEIPKSKIAPFKNYKDYENRLLKTLQRLVNNADSPWRKSVRYGLVTTISKGYDAAACAAIAFEVGCKKAVSFNMPQKYANDCGDDIAKKLGYEIIVTKNANSYLNNVSFVEAEFVSSGELGTGIVFAAFENEFENSVVFIGTRGDKLWDKNWTDYNKEFRFDREIFSDTSKVENRLKAGYIMLPLPLFGAKQWPSIFEINNSDEMRPYSVGGNYDRPIPRRILETRGIERKMFGQTKKGAGFNYRFDNFNRISKRMSKKSFNSFRKFYLENRRSGLNVIFPWLRFLWHTKSLYISYFLKKIGIPMKSKTLTADAFPNPGAPSYLFNWGVSKMIRRYEKADIEKHWLEKDHSGLTTGEQIDG